MSNPNAGRALDKGSEWRKWDLHVHAPGTRLNDNYRIDGKSVKSSDEVAEKVWDEYCRLIDDSDVDVIGITDYFTFKTYFKFRDEYKRRYPRSEKTFFPNLELRLPNSVNKSGQHVNFHMLFPDTLTEEDAENFLRNLKLTESSSSGTRRLTAWEMRDREAKDVETFSAGLDACVDAVKQTFDGIRDDNLHEAAFLIVSGKKDGISPGRDKASNKTESSKGRNAVLIDEIDLRVHGIFANSSSREHWLDPGKRSGESGKQLAPHPTFGGSDAHSFERLEAALGKTISVGHDHAETTWIKAKPTWSGLLQTLVEPDSRVAIQELTPESKEDYLVIDSVEFKRTGEFPERIELNSGLNAIIGSRSSGKSALLAHIAYAISPSDTIEIQQKCGMNDPGPAAGYSWTSVSEGFCRVNWKNGLNDKGYLVYVPQNFLNQLSSQPEQVNQYIIPAIRKGHSNLYESHIEDRKRIEALRADIDALVGDWFKIWESIQSATIEVSKFPKEEALREEKSKMQKSIAKLSETANLTSDDLASHKAAHDEITDLEEGVARGAKAISIAEGLVSSSKSGENLYERGLLNLEVDFLGLENFISDAQLADLNRIRNEAVESIQLELGNAVVMLISDLTSNTDNSEKRKTELQEANKGLFERVKSNSAIESERLKIADIEAKEKELRKNSEQLEEARSKLAVCAKEIEDKILERSRLETNSVEAFNREVRMAEGKLELSLESQFTGAILESVSDSVSKKGNRGILGEDGLVQIDKAQADPGALLEGLASGEIKLLKNADREIVGKRILKASPEFRFSAKMDGDTIGGFDQSTMTPGKQALFALTLILSDSSETWPLLIDQPEDDLDSKSIYSEIVSFLKQQKRRRQIIMVTHNANLVVGADAELVIVANRHGDDRRNESGQVFDYFSGALEESGTYDAEFDLDKLGIREHVVEILDGGEDAFRKRRQKYNL